ncbi:MAG: DNA topoisomerase IV subunit B [Pseudomonadota bacterium]|jgi:topoisomerase-4 subunit B
MAQSRYDEASIRVLKGLEPVRERPGMYTRTSDPGHIVAEAIDNCVDEALAGHARRIEVTLHEDGSVSVADDGRGIPVGPHPEERIPVVELVFTRLHAGGKFDKRSGEAYSFAGGLHGVGVSVTNALSTRLDVEVRREGSIWQIGFAGGEVASRLRKAGDAGRETGTRLRIWPDPKYFDQPGVPLPELERLLRSKAAFLPEVTVSLAVERAGGRVDRRTWRYRGGIEEYLDELLAGASTLVPVFSGAKYAGRPGDNDSFAEGEGAAWAITWVDEASAVRESYVNLIPTAGGGTHDSGLREGVFNAVRNFIELHNLLPKGVKLQPEDVFGRACYILSARVLDPQFQGQTKERLTSRDAVRLVSTMVRDPADLWLNEHVEHGRAIAELAIRQAQQRMRSAQNRIEKKKGSGVAVLPGKLSDCESADTADNEIFLVEGDSAGGSAKQGRDKNTQAILPLRGKVLNSWEQDRDRLYANTEIHDIAVAIGVDPHDVDAPESVLDNLRYGRVAIMADADVDGSHIQVLLLTLFLRHFPRLIERGHVCIAKPPLYRVDVPAQGKRTARKLYAIDDAELAAIEDKLRKEGVREGAWQVQRFKGLGEMSAEQLWETAMNPATRRLLPVAMTRAEMAATLRTFTMLMGKGEAASRRAWMERHGNEVEADV